MFIQHSIKTLAKSISIAILMCISLFTQAAVYTTQKSGAFDKQDIWTPFYPGNTIKESDTVVINHAVTQNIDVVVKGTLIIKEKASLTGDRNMIVVKTGTLFNLGATQFGLLTNRGAIFNQQRLDVTMDFVNSGNVINHSKIEVGNMVDNTGLLTGKGGKISATGKFVNSRTGSIDGNMDVCSNNFLNVEGGSINTQIITFCGNPIFDSNNMFSKENAPMHFEKSASSVNVRGGGYSPF
jgi:hypothetical protein